MRSNFELWFLLVPPTNFIRGMKRKDQVMVRSSSIGNSADLSRFDIVCNSTRLERISTKAVIFDSDEFHHWPVYLVSSAIQKNRSGEASDNRN